MLCITLWWLRPVGCEAFCMSSPRLCLKALKVLFLLLSLCLGFCHLALFDLCLSWLNSHSFGELWRRESENLFLKWNRLALAPSFYDCLLVQLWAGVRFFPNLSLSGIPLMFPDVFDNLLKNRLYLLSAFYISGDLLFSFLDCGGLRQGPFI